MNDPWEHKRAELEVNYSIAVETKAATIMDRVSRLLLFPRRRRPLIKGFNSYGLFAFYMHRWREQEERYRSLGSF